MDPYKAPFPGDVNLPQRIAALIDGPYVTSISGEITASVHNAPLGSPRRGGRVSEVFLSLGASGKDDTNTLSLELDILVNGSTIFGTKPKLAHVSGEASQQKTTAVTGDTGVTQGVMGSTNTYNAGDVISYEATVTRTASPTTEMANAVIVVVLEPGIGR